MSYLCCTQIEGAATAWNTCRALPYRERLEDDAQSFEDPCRASIQTIEADQYPSGAKQSSRQHADHGSVQDRRLDRRPALRVRWRRCAHVCAEEGALRKGPDSGCDFPGPVAATRFRVSSLEAHQIKAGTDAYTNCCRSGNRRSEI